MSTPANDALFQLLRSIAFERKRVVLASGRESDFYIDCRKVSLHPEGLVLCGQALFHHATTLEKEWIGENYGIAPDIFVRQDAKSLEQGGDPQLERAVKELMEKLKSVPVQDMSPPAYPTPAKLD